MLIMYSLQFIIKIYFYILFLVDIVKNSLGVFIIHFLCSETLNDIFILVPGYVESKHT